MSDQFQQNPEDELPNWLKDLRKRGSVEGEPESPEPAPAEVPDHEELGEFPSESVEEAGPLEPFPAYIEEPKQEEISSEPDPQEIQPEQQLEQGEPDWLLEIRRRHQQSEEGFDSTEADDPEEAAAAAPSSELPEEFKTSSEADALANADSEDIFTEEHSLWGPPSQAHTPPPIMQVPVEPPGQAHAQEKDQEEDSAEVFFDEEEEPQEEVALDWLEESGADQPINEEQPSGFLTDESNADELSEGSLPEDAAESVQDGQYLTGTGALEAWLAGDDLTGEMAPDEQDPEPFSISADSHQDEVVDEEIPFSAEPSFEESEEIPEIEESSASAWQDDESSAWLDDDTDATEAPAEGDAQQTDRPPAQTNSFESWLTDQEEEEGIEAVPEFDNSTEDSEDILTEPEAESESEAPQENYEELVSWLADESQDPSAEASSARPFTDASSEDELEPAELPSWLQALKPSADAVEQAEDNAASQLLSSGAEELYRDYYPDEQLNDAGPLEGLTGILPVEPEIIQYGRSKMHTGELAISNSQLKHVSKFEQLIEEEGAPIEDQSKRISVPMRLLRIVFATLIMLAILFPLFNGSQLASRAPIGSLPESTLFFNQVELLPADAPILVAFEVQPSLYGAMKPLASAVLDHLLAKQAHLVFISTQATGPALVEKLLREELSHQPAIASGDYVNLGYLSGETAALRYFAANPRSATLLPQLWSTPTLTSVNSIANFGMVVVISSDAADGRAWIEQVSPYTSNGLMALSSAQAAPLLLPYLQSQPTTLRALVSGLNGAGYYESLRSRDGLGRAYWDAYSYGLGAIVILILMGGLYSRLIQIAPQRIRDADNAK